MPLAFSPGLRRGRACCHESLRLHNERLGHLRRLDDLHLRLGPPERRGEDLCDRERATFVRWIG